MKLQCLLKQSLLAVIFIVLSGCTSEHSTQESKEITREHVLRGVNQLDSLVNSVMEKTKVPGIAVAVVYGDEVLYAKGFGQRSMAPNSKAVDADTVFQLASVSKSLASTVVAGAVGRGYVQWDDHIIKYLPNFTLKNPDVTSKVSIADMFSHRSGLPGDAADDLEIFGCNRSEIVKKLAFLPLAPYGTTYHYTNFGLTVGGEAAAVASKQSWEDLSSDILYRPLGMTSSSSRWIDYKNRINKADIHIKNAQGQWVVSARQPDAQSPAGGASASVNDMAKWMMLELHKGTLNGRRIIDENALIRTWDPVMKTVDGYYGLGKVTSHDKMYIMHSGAFSAGASTAFSMIPSAQLGIVVLTNGFPLGVPETIYHEFYDIVNYGSPQKDWLTFFSAMFERKLNTVVVSKPTPNSPGPGPKKEVFIGHYANDYYGVVTITAKSDGFLMALNVCNRDAKLNMSLKQWDGNTFSIIHDDNNEIISTLYFMPAEGVNPAKIRVEFLDNQGMGTFKKIR